MDFIPLSVPNLAGNEWEYVKECIDTEWVSSAGKFVDTFETNFASFTGAGKAVAVVNGTAALHISLIAAGVKLEDAIIVPTLTFIATINVVKYMGAEPIFMDCDNYYNIDAAKTIEFLKTQTEKRADGLYHTASGRRISAIIPVHIFGNAVQADELFAFCRELSLPIIEDATESLGTRYTNGTYAGKHTGLLGDYGCFSFNGNKIITTGGGGMVLCADGSKADYIRYLTTQAKDDAVRFVHNEVGYNYRLTNIQAALGAAQMEQLDGFIKVKQQNWQQMSALVNNIAGLNMPDSPAWANNNHWFYPVQVDKAIYGMDVEGLMAYLSQNSIQTRPVWHLNHLQKPFAGCPTYKLQKSLELAANTLMLPCSTNLTGTQVKHIAQVLANK